MNLCRPKQVPHALGRSLNFVQSLQSNAKYHVTDGGQKILSGNRRAGSAVLPPVKIRSSATPNYPLDGNNPSTGGTTRSPDMLDMDDGIQEARLSTYHYVAFFVVMCGGLLFVALLLYFTGDIAFQRAIFKAVKRLLKTVALRQLITILSAIVFIKYGLEPAIKLVRAVTKAQGPWEKSPEYYILKEVGSETGASVVLAIFGFMVLLSANIGWS